MALNAQQILDADDRHIVAVHVPEWGADGDDVVCLQLLDAIEDYEFEKARAARDAARGEPASDGEKQHWQFLDIVAAVAVCIVDETGQRLFTTAQVEDLARKSPAALVRLHRAIVAERQRLLAAWEAELKNVEPTANGGSGCASPSTKATDTPTR